MHFKSFSAWHPQVVSCKVPCKQKDEQHQVEKNFASSSWSWVPCTNWGRCWKNSTLFFTSSWLTIARRFTFSTLCLSSNCIRGGGTSFLHSFTRGRSIFFSDEAATSGTSFFCGVGLTTLPCFVLVGAAPPAED